MQTILFYYLCIFIIYAPLFSADAAPLVAQMKLFHLDDIRAKVDACTNSLIKAAATVDFQTFDKYVLIQGVDASDENGITPLIAAIMSGQNRIVFHALLHGADPCGLEDGYLPLDVVKSLLKNKMSFGLLGSEEMIKYAIDIKHTLKGCTKCGVEKAPLYDPEVEVFDLDPQPE